MVYEIGSFLAGYGVKLTCVYKIIRPNTWKRRTKFLCDYDMILREISGMPVWLLTTINKPNDEINGQLWAKKGTDVEFFVNYIPAGRPDLPVICFPHPKAQYSY